VFLPTCVSVEARRSRCVRGRCIEIAGGSARVLVEQTTAVTPERLGDSVGRLSARELGGVDPALALVFGL
jgi:hypothetical protein